jgi:cyclopropane fatty-acyl-phospholipid synthase-like methyltransferase
MVSRMGSCSATGSSWKSARRCPACRRPASRLAHVESLREHNALTLRAWVENLERHWDEAVAEVDEARARIWRLYMAGSALSFERGDSGL